MSDARGPQLDLTFERRGGRTVLADRSVRYPFFVTAPLRGRGSGAEVIVQSISGGLFGDDRIVQQVTIGEDAEAVIRMPSATVVHDRRGNATSTQTVELRAGSGATLLYLPRPLILLPGSGLVQSMEITLDRQSVVCVQDGFLMHDPHGLSSAVRAMDSRVTIRSASGRLLARDRMRVTDEMVTAAAPGVAGAYRAFGALWLLCAPESDASRALKAAVEVIQGDRSACYVAMTPLRAGIGAMVRLAARDGGYLDIAFTTIREALTSCLTVQPLEHPWRA